MIQHITKPFKYFFKLEAASGLVLLFAAVLALIISNGGFSEIYFSVLEKYITLGTKEFGLKLSVLHWINDVLMAIFFFVSLEIKREFIQGELSIQNKLCCLLLVLSEEWLFQHYFISLLIIQTAQH